MKKLHKLYLGLIFACCLAGCYGLFQLCNAPVSAANGKRAITNLGILIKFSNSDDIVAKNNAGVPLHIDDAESLRNAEQLLNSDQPIATTAVVSDSESTITVASVKKYYETQSYGKLSVITPLFPKVNSQTVAYQDTHPIEYYLPQTSTNTLGYADSGESLRRELTLLENAVNYVSAEVSQSGISANDLDTDNDGRIDAISLFVEGAEGSRYVISFQDLLWSHERVNTNTNLQILGKTVAAYTLIYCTDYTQSAGTFSLNRSGYGTIIHEFGHTLGFQDLYRHSNGSQSYGQPVGFYDVMGRSPSSNPAHFLSYFTSTYRSAYQWHNPLPVIAQTTTNITLHKPQFSDPGEQRAVIIRPNNGPEYFIAEYYTKQSTYSSYTSDKDGIIIYRVNDNNSGNGNANNDVTGAHDHIFVFRPEETTLGAAQGNLSLAPLNSDRPKLGKALSADTAFNNETIYYSNGSNSGIIIEVISETQDSVTINITLPEVTGDGSQNNPYIISTVEQFLYLMQNDTTGKYYILASDLDFSGRDYPAIDFRGHLDGRNYTLDHIQATGHGIFGSIGDMNQSASVKNLSIEKLAVTSTGSSVGSSLGGLATVIENSLIQNVHLVSGSVTNTASLNDAAATGGFAGNVNESSTIESCSSNLTVSAPRNVGGFIGLNMNAKITNSTATGKVTGNTNVGGFIGVQAITSTYQIPQNATYDADLNPMGAVGGYLDFLHDLAYLPADKLDQGITPISNSGVLSEATILQRTNLTRRHQYLVGFKLQANITEVKQLFTSLPQVTISNFRNANNQEITSGAIATGMQFAVHNGAETFSYTVVIKGDANGDGAIQATDYVRIRNHIMGKTQLSGAYLEAADVNNDSKIHATDYVKVRNHIMGKTAIEQK